MNKMSVLPKIAVLMVFMYAQPGVAYELVEKAPPDAMKLTADDYAEIQQLAIRYAWLLDHCTNGGYDYADLYVDDGQFSTADGWGTSSNEQRTSLAKGREALAKAAGGGANGQCVPPKEYLGYGITHIVTNHMITPTKTGAVGKHRLIAVGICGYPHLMELQGGYEDVYVKTKEGWKFKSRTHVFEKTKSLQFGVCANK
jgi:hypothetical protein